jgi:hypothetical protein
MASNNVHPPCHVAETESERPRERWDTGTHEYMTHAEMHRASRPEGARPSSCTRNKKFRQEGTGSVPIGSLQT